MAIHSNGLETDLIPESSLLSDPNTGAIVTVIIPTFNRELELQRAIKSVLSQTLKNFEIIVVDDFSSDDIASVVNSFGDKRIKYIKLAKKGNANIARNVGIHSASGEFIAFLDSDDEYMPFHLENRINKFKEWDCDVIYGSACVVTVEGSKLWYTRNLENEESALNFLLSDGFAPTPSIVIKSKLIKQILWDEHLLRHQDYDLFMRLAEKGKLMADNQTSVIINWNSPRDINFSACIEFIDRNKQLIHPKTYVVYIKSMFDQASGGIQTKLYQNYYRNEAKKYIKHISLMEFLAFYGNKSRIQVHLVKLYFLFLVLTTKQK